LASSRITQVEFVESVRGARQEWERLIGMVPREDMTRPGFAGDWTLKDVIAHIAWYEREMVNMIKAKAFVGSSHWELPTDPRNDVIYAENKDRSLDEILRKARQTHDDLVLQLASLSDEDLHDPARFPGMPADWQPWSVIASNTYEHYEDHIPQAKAWLQK
jgi:uncharacterized protein (TIGR03083 family)